jgi:hypothetical protein
MTARGRLFLLLGPWVAYAYLPVGRLVKWMGFLNPAQEGIRDMVRARNDPGRPMERKGHIHSFGEKKMDVPFFI